MPHCAAFGCNNNSSKASTGNFFRFPKDKIRRKAWIHYCRRDNFEPVTHRLCSLHFSKDQYEVDPERRAELGYLNARARLKPTAVPDLLLPLGLGENVLTDASDSSAMSPSMKPQRVRGAYHKRRNAEVLQQAIQTYDANYVLDTSEGTCDVVEVDAAELDTPALATSPQSQPQERKRSVKVQAKIDPIRRTRKIQVRVASKSIGIQCELLKPTCDSDNETELDSEDNNDPEIYNDSEYEPDTDDELDDERDSDGSGDFDDDMPMNYRLDKDAKPEDQHQFLVSESALAELMSTCRSCCLPAQTFVKFSRGTMIATNSVCVSGHISEWRSQPCDGRMPWSNLFTAGAIFFSGINCAKALHLFEGMNLQTFSKRTFTTLQTSYIVPVVEVVWEKHQASLIQERAGNQIICGGDARCDSPGFSAKYGAYTLVDLEAKKVLDMQLVQSNEVKGSTHMEIEGLKRGLDHIINDNGLIIKALITDRHRMVQKYMREEQEDVKHYFDVWHLAKGISKKLEAAAKKKDCEMIQPWIKSTVNHAYWVAASCGDNSKLKVAKWESLMNHIANKHEDHSTIFSKCEHGPILEERQWLKEGSRAYKLMDKVIRSPHILRDIQKLSPIYQTYGLEVFHNVVNHYAPKSTHFFYGSMRARLHIAALHYNENSNNAHAVTKTGQERWRIAYPKSKKGTEAVVKPCKVDPTFGYIALLRQALLDLRQELPTCTEAHMFIKGASQYPPPLTEAYKQFSKDELIRKHKSRFLNS